MTRQRIFKTAGALTMVAAIFGFVTVADDLRHVGELWGTISILAAGICLFVAGSVPAINKWFGLHWLAVAFLAALPVGAWMDRMHASVIAFAIVGLGIAHLRRQRSTEGE